MVLAADEDGIIMLTKRRIPTVILYRLRNEEIHTARKAKYLEVRLDCKLTFWDLILQACILSRLMANTGEPMLTKRRLLML